MQKHVLMGEISEKRLLNLEEVVIYIGLGRVTARKYMDEIGATKKFGKRVLFDKTIIDTALNEKGV